MSLQEHVLLGKQDLLYKVDHARLRIGHLPVLGQRLLALVTWHCVPVAEVHVAAGLCVAGHSLPPLWSLLVFCEWKEQKERKWERGGEKTQEWGVIHTLNLSSTAEQTFQPSQETERNRERERQTTRATRFACQDWCSGSRLSGRARAG